VLGTLSARSAQESRPRQRPAPAAAGQASQIVRWLAASELGIRITGKAIRAAARAAKVNTAIQTEDAAPDQGRAARMVDPLGGTSVPSDGTGRI